MHDLCISPDMLLVNLNKEKKNALFIAQCLCFNMMKNWGGMGRQTFFRFEKCFTRRTLYYQFGIHCEFHEYKVPPKKVPEHTRAHTIREKMANLHNQLKNYFQLDGRKFVVIIMSYCCCCSLFSVSEKCFKSSDHIQRTYLKYSKHGLIV